MAAATLANELQKRGEVKNGGVRASQRTHSEDVAQHNNRGQPQEQQSLEKEKKPPTSDHKPRQTDYKKLQGRRAMPNSMKDPFYSERVKANEERQRRQQPENEHQTAAVQEARSKQKRGEAPPKLAAATDAQSL